MTEAAMRTIPRPTPGEPPRPRVPAPRRFTLANGLRVVAVPRPGVPQVAMRLVLPAGSVGDTPPFFGTAALVGALLTEGTERFTADEFATRLDRIGAALGVQVGHDFAEVDLALLSETLAAGVELLAEVLVRPAFPAREVERVRAETLDLLEARADEPANEADDRAALAVFGPEHPYGRLSMGSETGVASVRRDGLVDFHAARYRPEGSVLVVCGDFDGDALPALLEGALAGWTGAAAPLDYPAPPAAPLLGGELVRVGWPGSAQGELRVAGLGLPRTAEDWVPAAVANYLLGGSTITGRLGANLREDKGWTYGVRSGFAAAIQPGGWAIDTAVDVQVVDAALSEIDRELERFRSEPVGEVELERAKRSMILSLPRAFETPGRVVGRFATVEAYGLEPDYWERFPARVEAVTADAVLSLARALFAPDRLVRVAVGAPEGS